MKLNIKAPKLWQMLMDYYVCLPCPQTEEIKESDPVEIYNLSKVLSVSASDIKCVTRRDTITFKVFDLIAGHRNLRTSN